MAVRNGQWRRKCNARERHRPHRLAAFNCAKRELQVGRSGQCRNTHDAMLVEREHRLGRRAKVIRHCSLHRRAAIDIAAFAAMPTSRQASQPMATIGRSGRECAAARVEVGVRCGVVARSGSPNTALSDEHNTISCSGSSRKCRSSSNVPRTFGARTLSASSTVLVCIRELPGKPAACTSQSMDPKRAGSPRELRSSAPHRLRQHDRRAPRCLALRVP